MRRPEVRVQEGELRGVEENNAYGGSFLAFRGIPYAKPPLGQLRFKDPEPADAWSGVRDASKFGGICAHFDILNRKVIGGDDCLYLNVYTTSIGEKRPVMVWIHGGAFIYGSGNDLFYGPDYLVRKDVVIVTINYRLGVLGFLNLQDEIAPGNQGLKDQVMALKWVQRNISNFGGDPDNVTIFGESAGGASVHYLCLSPMAQGLFHKAISQSGVAVNPWASVVLNPRKYAIQIAANLGKESTDSKTIVDFLRTVDAKELVEAQGRLISQEESLRLLTAFGPGVDSASPNPFLTELPSVAMKAGVRVPYLMGLNSNEGSFFVRETDEKIIKKVNEDVLVMVHPNVLRTLEQVGVTPAELRCMYFGNEPIVAKSAQKCADFLSDTMFCRGIYDVAKLQMDEGHCPTYFYLFSYDSKISPLKLAMNITLPGTTHSDDLFYLFLAYLSKDYGMEPPKPGSTEHKIIEYFTQMWTDFAKTGNPTPRKTELVPVIWKPLKKGNTYDYLRIDEELQMETADRDSQRCEWEKLKCKL